MAEIFFSFLFLISFICLIVGLIKPTAFSRFIKGEITRKKIGLIFGIVILALFILSEITTNTNETKVSDIDEKFVKVISITGNQLNKSEEFVINSKEIKFVYQCENGLFFCGGRLYQVGGANQDLFRSPGDTGNLSGEKILSVGPGTFYISIDTRDRAYKIDVFQGANPASIEEKTKVQIKVDDNEKYRNVSGFALTSENMVSGILTYSYKTDDGVYIIELDVYPQNQKMTDLELEEEYTLAKGSLKINDVNIQYAFDKGSELNGVVISKPYRGAEFVFIIGEKTHFGWVMKADSNETLDQAVIESTLKPFLNAIVPNIK
ncbi:MAG: hypothetical protein WC926_04630 [Candidatus Paceibacterota bacterium]|jgi:hypothetical protein|nr:hypothetical protein [Candidatus Omnitrophota bacterium]